MLKNDSEVTVVPKNIVFLKILKFVQSFVECKVSLADGIRFVVYACHEYSTPMPRDNLSRAKRTLLWSVLFCWRFHCLTFSVSLQPEPSVKRGVSSLRTQNFRDKGLFRLAVDACQVWPHFLTPGEVDVNAQRLGIICKPPKCVWYVRWQDWHAAEWSQYCTCLALAQSWQGDRLLHPF
jgi:hypothetical protein